MGSDRLYILCIKQRKLLKTYTTTYEFNKIINRMNTKFINSENSTISDPRRILINLSDKTNLKRSDKYVALSNLSIYYTQKNLKISYKNNKFKISAPTWNEKFEFLMHHILYQIFKIVLNMSLKES